MRVRVPLRPFITQRSFQKIFVYCCPRVAHWHEPPVRCVCGGGFTGTFDIVGMYLSCCVFPSFLETSSTRIRHLVMRALWSSCPQTTSPGPLLFWRQKSKCIAVILQVVLALTLRPYPRLIVAGFKAVF